MSALDDFTTALGVAWDTAARRYSAQCYIKSFQVRAGVSYALECLCDLAGYPGIDPCVEVLATHEAFQSRYRISDYDISQLNKFLEASGMFRVRKEAFCQQCFTLAGSRGDDPCPDCGCAFGYQCRTYYTGVALDRSLIPSEWLEPRKSPSPPEFGTEPPQMLVCPIHHETACLGKQEYDICKIAGRIVKPTKARQAPATAAGPPDGVEPLPMVDVPVEPSPAGSLVQPGRAGADPPPVGSPSGSLPVSAAGTSPAGLEAIFDRTTSGNGKVKYATRTYDTVADAPLTKWDNGAHDPVGYVHPVMPGSFCRRCGVRFSAAAPNGASP